MGSIFSVQVSCDSLIACCRDCGVGQPIYKRQLKDNLEKLMIAIEELKSLKNDVMRRVRLAEGQQMKRLEHVQWWVSRVEATITEVDELIRESPQELEKLCLGGYCSRSCRSSYVFGKRVTKRLKNVADLKGKGDFKEVAEKVPEESVIRRPSEPLVGFETMIDHVWICLMEEQVGIVGLYGMGGVGKTTLLTQINNRFTPDNFDVVIWVVVSRDVTLEKIQEDIGKRIGFSDEQWKNKNLNDKAEDIFNVLCKKKFVLLLDDIWERVNLMTVGVPRPDEHNGSKVVFTTRSEEVCSQMDAQKRIKVEALTWEKAWELFQDKVGQDTLKIHEQIPSLAKTVAKKCGGLPLALITIGRAMACNKTPEEWQHAVEVLRNSASNIQGMGDNVFPLLKFSYDNLPSDKIRSCFLYCSLFPEDFKISKDNLIDYWICERFWDGHDDNRAGTHNEGYNIIGTLVCACLLEDEGKHVKMHDVIRDMALWVACKCEREKEYMLVQTGARLTDAPEIRNWNEVRRMSLMKNFIRNLTLVPKCPNMLTMFLCHNRLSMISSGFFQCMDSLTVLDLSNNVIKELPIGISKLVSLQYLNLSHTMICQLPLELKMLANLRYLNLEHTNFLGMIPRQLICSFSLLQVLRMFHCGFYYKNVKDDILSNGNVHVEELQCLEHLTILSITIRCASALQCFLSSNNLPGCTRALSLESFNGSTSLNISWLAEMKHLQKIQISHSNDLEELKVEPVIKGAETQSPTCLHDSAMLTGGWFNSLRIVSVEKCCHLRDLTWLVLAPHLESLAVLMCEKMEEIINGEILVKVVDVGGNLNPFARLEILKLDQLPQLKSIYWKALPFPHLKKIEVLSCPKLKNLPLNSNSERECKVVIEAEQNLLERY